jgi:hypothetical protein
MKSYRNLLLPIPNSTSGRALATCMAAVALLSTASHVTAQTAFGSESQSLFGPTLLGQGNAAIPANNNVSCAPTSIANGLSVLYNVGNNSTQFAGGSPNNYATVNGLATSMGVTALGATYGTATGIANGTASYLQNNDPRVQVTGQYAAATANAGYSANLLGTPVALGGNFQQVTPTAASLASFLNSLDGVEIGIQWGTYNANNTFTAGNGGHFVTLQSISLTLDPSNGLFDGSISYLDPWGNPANAAPGTAGQFVTASLVLNAQGFLDLGGIAAQEPAAEDAVAGDEFEGRPPIGNAGQIMVDVVESVPDGGSTSLLLGMSVLGMVAVRRKFCRSQPAL